MLVGNGKRRKACLDGCSVMISDEVFGLVDLSSLEGRGRRTECWKKMTKGMQWHLQPCEVHLVAGLFFTL